MVLKVWFPRPAASAAAPGREPVRTAKAWALPRSTQSESLACGGEGCPEFHVFPTLQVLLGTRLFRAMAVQPGFSRQAEGEVICRLPHTGCVVRASYEVF